MLPSDQLPPPVIEKLTEKIFERTEIGKLDVPLSKDKVSAVMGRVAGSIAQAYTDTTMTKAEQIVHVASVLESNKDKIQDLNDSYKKVIVGFQNQAENLDIYYNKEIKSSVIEMKQRSINPGSERFKNAIADAERAHRQISSNTKLKLENDHRALEAVFEAITDIKDKAKEIASSPVLKEKRVVSEIGRQMGLKTFEAQLPRMLQAMPILMLRLTVPEVALLSVALGIVDTITSPHASKAQLKDSFGLRDSMLIPIFEDTSRRSLSNFATNISQRVIEQELGWFAALVVSSGISSKLDEINTTTMKPEEVVVIVKKFLDTLEEGIKKKGETIESAQKAHQQVNKKLLELLEEAEAKDKEAQENWERTKRDIQAITKQFDTDLKKIGRNRMAGAALLTKNEVDKMYRHQPEDLYPKKKKHDTATPRGPSTHPELPTRRTPPPHRRGPSTRRVTTRIIPRIR